MTGHKQEKQEVHKTLRQLFVLPRRRRKLWVRRHERARGIVVLEPPEVVLQIHLNSDLSTPDNESPYHSTSSIESATNFRETETHPFILA